MLLKVLKRLVGGSGTTSSRPVASTAQRRQAPVQSESGVVAELLKQADLAGQVGNAVEAERLSREALRVDGASTAAHFELAAALYDQGNLDEALIHALYAQHHAPNVVEYVNQVGVISLAQGNYEKALSVLKRAYQLSPASPNILNNLGMATRHAGNPKKAYDLFKEAVALKPDFLIAKMNQALSALEIDLVDESVALAESVVAADSESPGFRFNLASIYLDSGNVDKAEPLLAGLSQTYGATSDYERLQMHLALQRGQVAEAKVHGQRALGYEASADNRYAMSEVLLLNGRWDVAWEGYDERLNMPGFPFRSSPIPPWQGQPLQGKSLYIQSEQGLGDQIMFATCIPELLAAGVRVSLECDERLSALYQRSFPGLTVVPHSGTFPPRAPRQGFDYITYLGSLPRYLRTGAASFPGYHPPLLQGPQTGAPKSGKIAICWRGGLPRTGRWLRSLELADVVAALAPLGKPLISLQRDETAAEKACLAGLNQISAYDSELDDLDCLASTMLACDAVVTVCCSVAHLAGALGVPTLVLTPAGPAWRYGAQGERMVWYPGVRLLRQQEADWAAVLAALPAAVSSMLQETR